MIDSTDQKLISLWLDDGLSSEQMKALESRLADNRDARDVFLLSARLHAELCNEAKSQEPVDSIDDQDDPAALAASLAQIVQEDARPAASTSYQTRVSQLALAASLLVGVTLWLAGTFSTTSPAPDGDVALADSASMITEVKPVDDRCVWYVEEAGKSQPRSYRSGDVFRVTEGSLTLRYTHGTNVVLHSPAAYQLVSVNRGKMIVGRLTATVPEAGKGFTVITPRADVIDLGTEFGVSVENDGATDVVVFKGAVDLDYHGKQVAAQRLRMGEAVRLDPGGTASRLVSVDGRAYTSLRFDDSQAPPILVEVRDNIERDPSMLSYYEIVHGGMREDALSHVDRIAHEYNGLTAKGMPKYLVGTDYVKVFNNDKNLTTLSIEVTVSRPARVYVLLDDRHPPPEWLTARFVDTGDDLGLDTGPFQTKGTAWHNKGPSGVGPGESIDDRLSVWVTEVSEPGVVRLGSVGTDLEVGGANMYGIAAAPLEAE